MSTLVGKREHRYLTLAPTHRSDKDATEYVRSLLKPRFPRCTKGQLTNPATEFTFNYGKGPFKRTFAELKKEARESGTVRHLRTYLYGNDEFFPPGLDTAIDGNVPGLQLKYSSRFVGSEDAASAPMRSGPVEYELCMDILGFRRDACDHSVFPFEECARYARAYTLACTSFVEAFLHRPIAIRILQGRATPDIEALTKPMSMEERLERWVRIFCTRPLSDLKGSTGWDHFKKLRAERNKLVHPDQSILGTGVKPLALHLNLA